VGDEVGEREGAAKAQVGWPRRATHRHVHAVDQNAAGCGRKLTRDQIEVGGLAGAVRSDNGGERAGMEHGAHAVDGDVTAKADGKTFSLQDGLGHAAPDSHRALFPGTLAWHPRYRHTWYRHTWYRHTWHRHTWHRHPSSAPWQPRMSQFAVSGPQPSAGGELLHAKRHRHVVGGDGRRQLQDEL